MKFRKQLYKDYKASKPNKRSPLPKSPEPRTECDPRAWIVSSPRTHSSKHQSLYKKWQEMTRTYPRILAGFIRVPIWECSWLQGIVWKCPKCYQDRQEWLGQDQPHGSPMQICCLSRSPKTKQSVSVVRKCVLKHSMKNGCNSWPTWPPFTCSRIACKVCQGIDIVQDQPQILAVTESGGAQWPWDTPSSVMSPGWHSSKAQLGFISQIVTININIYRIYIHLPPIIDCSITQSSMSSSSARFYRRPGLSIAMTIEDRRRRCGQEVHGTLAYIIFTPRGHKDRCNSHQQMPTNNERFQTNVNA